ncbi:hypothetical protein [Rhodococcus sp. OK302]|nr:hypothetical protein [Rhodococcus sp. OK302]
MFSLMLVLVSVAAETSEVPVDMPALWSLAPGIFREPVDVCHPAPTLKAG